MMLQSVCADTFPEFGWDLRVASLSVAYLSKSSRHLKLTPFLPIKQQHLDGEFELVAQSWSDVVLRQVEGNSPAAAHCTHSVHDLNRSIIHLMDDEGVVIPFPTQTLDFFRG
jgi:hypothetical protein